VVEAFPFLSLIFLCLLPVEDEAITKKLEIYEDMSHYTFHVCNNNIWNKASNKNVTILHDAGKISTHSFKSTYDVGHKRLNIYSRK